MRQLRKTILLFAAAVGLLAAACDKEVPPKYPESQLVGTWKIPLTQPLSDASLAGKEFCIFANHTAALPGLYFNSWKIEDDVVTFLHDTVISDRFHEIGQLKVTVADLTDTTMTITGKYIFARNSEVDPDKEIIVDGLYERLN